jgi:hypothetical protein
MNEKNFTRFLEAIGHRVITSSSGHWFDISRGFYEYLPPYRLIVPDQEEIDGLFREFRVFGLKYCAPCRTLGKPSWIYLCRRTDYDIKIIHPKMRNKVRQGLRNCEIRPMTFDELFAQGMPLNLDTLQRQKRDDPLFSNLGRWTQLCRAGTDIPGTSAWGAFVDGALAAYMIIFFIGEYANILFQMSRTALLSSHANNALTFVATRELLSNGQVRCVSYGHASIRELPGLEEYKTRLGYEKAPMHYVVYLHPLVRPVFLNPLMDFLLDRLLHHSPRNDFLRQTRGILDICQYSLNGHPEIEAVQE